jgi:pyruvate/2-oxoglutarate dehydrogenase complex dihydrolipoamide acyltransferase (E2) component
MGSVDEQGNDVPLVPGTGGQSGSQRIKFVLPVPKELANSITQFFGPTDEPLDGSWGGYAHFNKGIDWASPNGSSFPVYAAAEGKVIWAGPDGSWGNSVKVQIADGRIVTYNHLAEINVKAGDTVRAGQPIGKAGSTGASTGTHLSFDIFEPDGRTPVDPSEYFGTNLARDNRRGGGSSGGSYFDTPPRVGLQQRQQLQSQRDYLFQLRDTLTKQDPGGNAAAIAELTKLITQLDQAIWEIDTYGYAGYEDWAKQALEAKVRLGDLELRKASQLFTEWLNKNTAAFQATANQLASASEHNKAIDESLANYGKTRMALPQVYEVAPTFEEAYNRWKKEFNVGSPPTLTEAVNTNIAVPVPSQPGWAGQGDPFTPEQASEASKDPRQALWDKWRQQDYSELDKLGNKSGGGSGNGLVDVLTRSGEVGPGAAVGAPVPFSSLFGADSVNHALTSKNNWGRPLSYIGNKLKGLWNSGGVTNGVPQTSEEFEKWYKTNYILAPSPDRSYVDPIGRTWVYDKESKKWVVKGPGATPTSTPTATPSRTPTPSSTPTPWWTPSPTPTPTPRSYAQGGKNIPGGLVTVGEQGPEHIVTPDGQVIPVGQQGPQTAIVPDGVDILPADVPPEQAYLYAKLKQLMQEDLATRDARKMVEAEQRRKDPNFEQKFRDAVARAAAALLAVNPPPTPQLVGDGWTYDPFYYERQLTGIGPDGVPLAQSQMQLPPDPRRQARMEQMQMEQQMQGAQA